MDCTRRFFLASVATVVASSLIRYPKRSYAEEQSQIILDNAFSQEEVNLIHDTIDKIKSVVNWSVNKPNYKFHFHHLTRIPAEELGSLNGIIFLEREIGINLPPNFFSENPDLEKLIQKPGFSQYFKEYKEIHSLARQYVETLGTASLKEESESEFHMYLQPLSHFASQDAYKETISHEFGHVLITLMPEFLENLPDFFHGAFFREDNPKFSELSPEQLCVKFWDINTLNKSNNINGYSSSYADYLQFQNDLFKKKRDYKQSLIKAVSEGSLNRFFSLLHTPNSEMAKLMDSYVAFVNSPDDNNFTRIFDIDNAKIEDIAETFRCIIFPSTDPSLNPKIAVIYDFLSAVYGDKNIHLRRPSINEQQYDILQNYVGRRELK